MRKVTIGLALGSGSARGWSHIGVINALAAQGVEPDIVCGTSAGAVVGASYAAGNLHKLERWVRSLTRFDTARFFEINGSLNGFVNTERLHQFLNEYVADDDALIEKFSKRYAAVATDLEVGREIWLDRGSVLEAVWSSMSLPGLFPAIRHNHRWLVDGGLVNPVPVSTCRALGADVVIAVNLNGDIVGRHLQQGGPVAKKNGGVVERITDLVAEYAASAFPPNKDGEKPSEDSAKPPGLFDAIASSVNVMQDRITRSRMAGDPPDILLSPRAAHIGLLEFYRAGDAIIEGERCVERMLPEIMEVLGLR